MVAVAEREEAQEKIYNKKVDFEEGWVFRDALKERHFSKNVWGAFEYSHYVCLNINRDLQEEGDKYKNTKPLTYILSLTEVDALTNFARVMWESWNCKVGLTGHHRLWLMFLSRMPSGWRCVIE
ncbi:hypothetical protein L3X38_009137 [Prunus dulcis]|uniref:Uncharacterized protein n=1 Tax=Prunus dulcis TaxID=3755 RepID=A0AAD4ZXQ4_PRUDU|nr:hypothetical protein L3X38_009137 [Prunus dulcis]